MAVQAQYPSSINATDFRVNNNNNVLLGNFHQDHQHPQYVGHHQVLIKNGTVFTTDPEISELNCNFVSASTTTTKKRKNSSTISTRGGGGGGDNDQMPHHQHYLNPQHQQHHQHQENVSSHNYNYNYNYYFPAASSCCCCCCCRSTKLPKLDQLISTDDHVICVKNKKSVLEENRLLNKSGSAGASTSRQLRRIRRSSTYQHDDDDEDAVLLSAVSSPQLVPLPLPPPMPQPQHSQHLTSSYSNYYLLHQNLDDDEIDALIRLQHETLRSVVEQTQCRLLMMSVLEQQQQQQVQRRLKEKQIELENAWGRKAELEEKVKQLSSENQMWFNVAKNNEAMVLTLRSTLEHHLLNLHLHQMKNQNTTTMGLVEAEGFGDSSDHGVLAADDAQSSNNDNYCHHHQQLQVNVGEREYNTVSSSNNVEYVRDHDDDDDNASMMIKEQQQQQQQHRKMCKVCKEMEVCVLLLPCRHLCLCKDCEAKLQACPICNSFKNASLQIFMS